MAREKKHAVCGARKRAGGLCENPAGKGTKHVGSGRCRLHGGNNGAKPGNKNALKTGAYETIFADAMNEDELAIMAIAAKKDNVAHLEEEIALTTIRERRMLLRIDALKKAEGLTVVEETTEFIKGEEGEPFQASERELAEMPTAEIDARSKAAEPEEDILKIKTKRAGTLGQIQAIEQDLTAVQAHKARLIKQLHDIQNPEHRLKLIGADGGPVAAEVTNGLPDDKRAAAVAALFERARARADGQALGAEG